MNMPDRIFQTRVIFLCADFAKMLIIFINSFWNHIKMQTLGTFWLAIHKQGQRFRTAIAQPVFNRQTIALGFRNFFTIRIKE